MENNPYLFILRSLHISAPHGPLPKVNDKVRGIRGHESRRGSGRINLLFLPLTSALDEVGGQRHAPATLLQGKTRYPFYRRLGWTHGRSGRVRKISSPLWFEPRTFRPVTCRRPLPRSTNYENRLQRRMLHITKI
jgi:hypothetical protein